MRLAGLVGALVVAASATTATAGPLFDHFQDICVTAAARETDVRERAKAAAWMPMPKAMLEQLSRGMAGSDGFTPEAFDGWLKSDANALTLLLWAHAKLPIKQAAQADLCAVAAIPARAQELDNLRSWAAVPEYKDFGKSGAQAFVFNVEAGGAHKALPKMSDAQLADAFVSGRIQIAMAQSDAQMSMMGLFVPAK